MSFTIEQDKKFKELKFSLRPENFDQIRRAANGGSSILFTYPPEEEQLYIEKAKAELSDICEFINLSELFVQFIEKEGWDDFKEYYKDFKTTPHLIFKSPDGTDDFYSLILNAIDEAAKMDKIPVLIRTGVLYGTGIDNSIIMEEKSVMRLPFPLLIFYPAQIKAGNLFFLNFKPASKYRCTIID